MVPVSKVLIAPTIPNLRYFGVERDTTEKTKKKTNKDQMDRFLEDLSILLRAFLTHLLPFESYGGLKKLKRSILLRLIVLKARRSF